MTNHKLGCIQNSSGLDCQHCQLYLDSCDGKHWTWECICGNTVEGDECECGKKEEL